ncbi:MAG: hypothetical protein HFJ03_02425 [Lachnospira sp.]|nr:hypothetical protein [Lachnospira sp.]
MIELHGWLSIVETYKNEDFIPQEEIEKIQEQVKFIIQNNTCDLEIQYQNGTPFLNTLVCCNHNTSQAKQIIEVYTKISEIATGSYGMIYVWDDEDKNYYNHFQTYIFKKGQCEYKIDTNFSPCIPTIEDAFID